MTPCKRKTPSEAVSLLAVSPASSSMQQWLLTPGQPIQQRGMHLPLSKHYTHAAMELALETDELGSFPLLLVCFAYYFLISSHNTLFRRSHKFGDFCCSATMYLKREICTNHANTNVQITSIFSTLLFYRIFSQLKYFFFI